MCYKKISGKDRLQGDRLLHLLQTIIVITTITAIMPAITIAITLSIITATTQRTTHQRERKSKGTITLHQLPSSQKRKQQRPLSHFPRGGKSAPTPSRGSTSTSMWKRTYPHGRDPPQRSPSTLSRKSASRLQRERPPSQLQHQPQKQALRHHSPQGGPSRSIRRPGASITSTRS